MGEREYGKDWVESPTYLTVEANSRHSSGGTVSYISVFSQGPEGDPREHEITTTEAREFAAEVLEYCERAEGKAASV